MKIGEALIKNGLISSQQLEVALSEQEKTKERLGDIVIKMGFVTFPLPGMTVRCLVFFQKTRRSQVLASQLPWLFP